MFQHIAEFFSKLISQFKRDQIPFLILFAPHAFVPQRQKCASLLPSPLVFSTISTDFTPTP